MELCWRINAAEFGLLSMTQKWLTKQSLTEAPERIYGFNYGFHSSSMQEQEKKIPDFDRLISGFS